MKIHAILVALIVLIPSVACEQSSESIKSGPVTINLGDGYTASFVLGSSENAYDIIPGTPSTSFGNKYFGFQIYPAGSDKEDLVEATMIISPSAQSWPTPTARREPDNSVGGILGVREVTPMTIDGSMGYVGYDWMTGNPATDINEAMGAFLHYFPRAQKTSDGIASYFDVTVETGNNYSQSLPVFQDLLNTLQIKGNIY
jgi:hypothetical protein